MPELRDIKPLILSDYPLWMIIMVGLCALLVIAGLTYYVWHAFATKKKNSDDAPTISAYDNAMNALRALATAHTTLTEIQFYAQLSDIIRSYIQNAYDYPARERTQEEIQQEFIDQTKITKSVSEMLMQLLIAADQVKFAEYTWGVDRQQGHLALTKKCLMHCKDDQDAAKQLALNTATNKETL